MCIYATLEHKKPRSIHCCGETDTKNKIKKEIQTGLRIAVHAQLMISFAAAFRLVSCGYIR